MQSAAIQVTSPDFARTADAPLLSTHVSALQSAVDAALAHADSEGEPRARAKAQARLLALLQDHVLQVTAARDEALAAMMQQHPAASNRELAKQLDLSRQRVDQLKRHIRAGGRRSNQWRTLHTDPPGQL